VRRLENRHLLADNLLREQRLDEAESMARGVAEAAERGGWREVHAQSMCTLAEIAMARADLAAAEDLHQRARAAFLAIGDVRHATKSLRELGRIAVLGGDPSRAEALLSEARAEAERNRDEPSIASCTNLLGDVARMHKDWDTAARWFREALALHAALGSRSEVGTCIHGLAEVTRLRGDVEEAERGYLEAMAISQSLAKDTSITELNLGLCRLQLRDFSGARRRLEPLRRRWAEQGRVGYLGAACASLLPVYAAARDEVAFDGAIGEAERLLAESGLVDVDIPWPAEMAGAEWNAAGDVGRERRCLALALGQWTAMGDASGEARVRDRLTVGTSAVTPEAGTGTASRRP
jgi:tetratricopeptide (TPR) repeat protein